MIVFDKKHHLLGATLLVAGTSIGVGMLALPVVTAAAGFLPSVFIYILAWLFMMGTGLLVVEACLWCPKDANLVTISRHLLGEKGAIGCWLLYLFLFYCLMVAHTAIGGQAIDQLGLEIPIWLSCLIYVALFAPAVYLGTGTVDRVNKIFITGVLVTFALFLIVSFGKITPSYLTRECWDSAWVALPVIFTAFGYQNLIPTLMTYMDRDHKRVRKAIIYGTSIPLVVYLIWELTILGTVPASALVDAHAQGHNAIIPLQTVLQKGALLTTIGQAFAFFTMTTSFIGLAIAFFDFWADGLKWKKQGWRRSALCALVFGVPLIITWINPNIFLRAINLAGGLGAALLLGLYPILFVWSGRYIHKYPTQHRFVKGGKITLAAMFLFTLSVICLSYL